MVRNFLLVSIGELLFILRTSVTKSFCSIFEDMSKVRALFDIVLQSLDSEQKCKRSTFEMAKLMLRLQFSKRIRDESFLNLLNN